MFSKRYRIQEIPLDADDISERNWRLYLNPDEKYETVDSHHLVKWRIKGSETTADLEQILEEFPYKIPVENQCGYWVRAISGVHPFPNANHRTATQTLMYVLNENGYSIDEVTGGLIGRCVNWSKRMKKGSDSITVTTDNLHERDALFRLWRDYFEFELWKRYLQGG